MGALAFVRDHNGMVTEQRYLDVEGHPVSTHDGVHRLEIQRDQAGRRVAERAFDLKGEPVLTEETGCHHLSWEHNDEGRVLERRCLDAKGDLARDRTEVAVERYALGEAGCVIGERYLDEDRKAITDYQGVHAVVRKVSPLCETTEKRCLNEQGALVSCGPNEPSIVRHRLDEAGQVEATTHHGSDGAPAGDPEFGVFELRFVLDSTGVPIEQTCFDETGGAAQCGSTGFHGRTTKIDEAGREVEAHFFDPLTHANHEPWHARSPLPL